MSEHLDPRKQLMIGALYGELSPEEEAAFRRHLADDPELATEWEELQATRELLGEWQAEPANPGFVFVGAAAPPARESFWARLRSGMSAPAWGFAATAALLTVLMANGFRVDRVNGSVVLGFGEPAPRVADNGFSGPAPTQPALGATPVQTVPASSHADYLTREELDTFAAGFLHTMENRLDDYAQRQNGELAYVMHNFYQDLREKQMQNYQLIMNQIEGSELWVAKRSRTRSLPDSLLSVPEDAGPSDASQPNPKEDDPR